MMDPVHIINEFEDLNEDYDHKIWREEMDEFPSQTQVDNLRENVVVDIYGSPQTILPIVLHYGFRHIMELSKSQN